MLELRKDSSLPPQRQRRRRATGPQFCDGDGVAAAPPSVNLPSDVSVDEAATAASGEGLNSCRAPREGEVSQGSEIGKEMSATGRSEVGGNGLTPTLSASEAEDSAANRNEWGSGREALNVTSPPPSLICRTSRPLPFDEKSLKPSPHDLSAAPFFAAAAVATPPSSATATVTFNNNNSDGSGVARHGGRCFNGIASGCVPRPVAVEFGEGATPAAVGAAVTGLASRPSSNAGPSPSDAPFLSPGRSSPGRPHPCRLSGTSLLSAALCEQLNRAINGRQRSSSTSLTSVGGGDVVGPHYAKEMSLSQVRPPRQLLKMALSSHASPSARPPNAALAQPPHRMPTPSRGPVGDFGGRRLADPAGHDSGSGSAFTMLGEPALASSELHKGAHRTGPFPMVIGRGNDSLVNAASSEDASSGGSGSGAPSPTRTSPLPQLSRGAGQQRFSLPPGHPPQRTTTTTTTESGRGGNAKDPRHPNRGSSNPPSTMTASPLRGLAIR